MIYIIRRLAYKRIPEWILPALWWIALIRLLIPYSFPVLREAPSSVAPPPAVPAVTVPGTPVPVQAEKEALPVPKSQIPIFPVVWGIGTLALSAFFTAAYLQCRLRFRKAEAVENEFVSLQLKTYPIRFRRIQVRQSAWVHAPMTYGILRPVIILPMELDWADTESLRYIFTHEQIHIRRYDTAAKLALTAAVCIHWYNPLVWLMYWTANRDIELSCDEAVLSVYGESCRAGYAMTLLHMEESKRQQIPFAAGFGKNACEERIEMMIYHQKKWKLLAAGAMAVVMSFAIVSGAYAVETSAVPRIPSISSAPASTAGDAPSAPTEQNLPSVVLEGASLQYYEGSKSPYIHDAWTNHTDGTIVTYVQGMLAFDKDGNPLKVKWDLFDNEDIPQYLFIYDWDTSRLAPGEKMDEPGGWSLRKDDSTIEKIEYVLYCYQSVTFEDGTVWVNGDYDNWLETYCGKKADPDVLNSYYPYVQTNWKTAEPSFK